MPKVEETLSELISNSQIAFLNGKLQGAFSLAKEAIKLDLECADAYQCAANVCMSLSRYDGTPSFFILLNLKISIIEASMFKFQKQLVQASGTSINDKKSLWYYFGTKKVVLKKGTSPPGSAF